MRKVSLLFFILINLSLSACTNVFHDLQSVSPAGAPLLPQIQYTYPGNEDSDVETNKRILISFNKEMDTSTITETSFVLREAGATPVTWDPLEFYEDIIIILTPASPLLNDTNYTIVLEEEIQDQEGNTISPGFTWQFTTGSTTDTEKPRINYYKPGMGELTSTSGATMTAKFSEDVDPETISVSMLKKPEDTVIDVNKEYSINAEGVKVLTITPRASLVNSSLYEVTVSGAQDLASPPNTMNDFTWSFRTGAILVELEPASNYSLGMGTFGSEGGNNGHFLRTDDGSVLFGLLEYDEDLSNILDTGISGSFLPGRYLRIVENGENIIGKGLTPMSWQLSGSAIVSPPGDQVYIDHVFGKFLLPRPIYWSRCEDAASISSPEISVPGYDPSLVENPSQVEYISGKLNNSGKLNSGLANRYSTIYPFGEVGFNDIEQGTISIWIKASSINWASANSTIYFGGASNYIRSSRNDGHGLDDTKLFINDAEVDGITGLWDGQWRHFYIVWDSSGELDDDFSVKVFVDGVLRTELCSKETFTTGIIYLQRFATATVGGSNVHFDNIKIWNHVVTEDPQWIYDYEYNGGDEGAANTKDGALHSIYDIDNGYQPVVDSSSDPDSGVGYYYLP